MLYWKFYGSSKAWHISMLRNTRIDAFQTRVQLFVGLQELGKIRSQPLAATGLWVRQGICDLESKSQIWSMSKSHRHTHYSRPPGSKSCQTLFFPQSSGVGYTNTMCFTAFLHLYLSNLFGLVTLALQFFDGW